MRFFCFLVILVQIINKSQNGCDARGMMPKPALKLSSKAFKPRPIIKSRIKVPNKTFGRSVSRHGNRFKKPSGKTSVSGLSRVGEKLNKYRNFNSKLRGKNKINSNRAGRHQSKTSQKTLKQKLKNRTKSFNKKNNKKGYKQNKVNGFGKKSQKKYGQTDSSSHSEGGDYEGSNVNQNLNGQVEKKNFFQRDGVMKAMVAGSFLGVGLQGYQMHKDDKRYNEQKAEEQKLIDAENKKQEQLKAQLLADCKTAMDATIKQYIKYCKVDTDTTDEIIQTCVQRQMHGLLATAHDEEDPWMQKKRMTAMQCKYDALENSE